MASKRAVRAAPEQVWPLLAPCLLVIAVTLLGSQGSAALQRNVLTFLVTLTVVVGFYIFVGNSGIFSFGHMSFMAVGAYIAALLTIPVVNKQFDLPNLPGFLATTELAALPASILAGLVAAAFAAVLAVPLMRLSGLNAGLASVAILIIVRVVAQNWEDVTRGTAGLAAIPVTTTETVALTWALVTMAAAFVYQRSRFGLRLRASREDVAAADSLGIRVTRERGIAFVLSAFFVGIGGSLFAQFEGIINPDAFYLNITFLVIAMLVIGGMTSLAGAVVGTVTLSVIAEALRAFERGTTIGPLVVQGKLGLTEVGLALLMLAILILRPRGITGGREIPWPFSSRSHALAAGQQAPQPDEDLGAGAGLSAAAGKEKLEEPR